MGWWLSELRFYDCPFSPGRVGRSADDLCGTSFSKQGESPHTTITDTYTRVFFLMWFNLSDSHSNFPRHI
jgi:hypothetical protein